VILRRSVLICLAGTLLVPSAAGAQQRVFFGNLHSHTSYSDGSGTPQQAYVQARDQGQLHFLAITEHNHAQAESGAAADRRDGVLIATNPSLYVGPQAEALIPTANALTQNGQFVALYGQEFSSISKGNHVNVYAVNDVIPVANGEFDDLVTWLEQHPASDNAAPIVQFNHPARNRPPHEYGEDDFSAADWLTRFGRFVSLIEVWNGPALTRTNGHEPNEVMEDQFLAYLNRGFQLAPTADQDNHYFTWGTITEARTAVIAPSLTSGDLLAALRARHVYATEDSNLELIFRVNGALQGDVITPAPAIGSELDIQFTVHDPDEVEAAYEIEVYSDDGPGGAVATLVDVVSTTGNTTSGQPNAIAGIRFRGPGQYVLFKVRQIGEHGNDDHAWTAPVWFEGGPTPPAPASPQLRITSLLPNPAGDELEDESVTIRNTGSTPVNLSGWTLTDPTGRTWSLATVGTIPAGANRTVLRQGQSMALNNGGDTVKLVAPDGTIVHQVTYQSTASGVTISVPPE